MSGRARRRAREVKANLHRSGAQSHRVKGLLWVGSGKYAPWVLPEWTTREDFRYITEFKDGGGAS